jgi:hypothetical protein
LKIGKTAIKLTSRKKALGKKNNNEKAEERDVIKKMKRNIDR